MLLALALVTYGLLEAKSEIARKEARKATAAEEFHLVPTQAKLTAKPMDRFQPLALAGISGRLPLRSQVS